MSNSNNQSNRLTLALRKLKQLRQPTDIRVHSSLQGSRLCLRNLSIGKGTFALLSLLHKYLYSKGETSTQQSSVPKEFPSDPLNRDIVELISCINRDKKKDLVKYGLIHCIREFCKKQIDLDIDYAIATGLANWLIDRCTSEKFKRLNLRKLFDLCLRAKLTTWAWVDLDATRKSILSIRLEMEGLDGETTLYSPQYYLDGRLPDTEVEFKVDSRDCCDIEEIDATALVLQHSPNFIAELPMDELNGKLKALARTHTEENPCQHPYRYFLQVNEHKEFGSRWPVALYEDTSGKSLLSIELPTEVALYAVKADVNRDSRKRQKITYGKNFGYCGTVTFDEILSLLAGLQGEYLLEEKDSELL